MSPVRIMGPRGPKSAEADSLLAADGQVRAIRSVTCVLQAVMHRGRAAALVAFAMLFCALPPAQGLDFTLHTQGQGEGRTLLVVGGIQGDEPGGFNAAALLVTRYRVTTGNVWVVPNLNFTSIVRRSRGVHGDMNRKFAAISSDDPEYHAIERIKQIILAEEVDLVLNLHDGSGFYRPLHQDRDHSPRRWGQCVVIDQERFEAPSYADLSGVAERVVNQVNTRLHRREHRFHVKNTRTPEGNSEMAKTLTWFAVRNGKAAFGLEASKTLPTHLRAYYHLLAVEAYMGLMGIEYSRSFELTPEGVRKAIDGDIRVALYENKILLDVAKARKHLRYVPLKKNAEIDFQASNPLLAVTGNGEAYKVSYGNRRMTYLHPQYFDYDDGVDKVSLTVDGRRVEAALGTVVDVEQQFMVQAMEGYRVNVIGWRRKGQRNESGVPVPRAELARRFSIDRDGRMYRVEFYRGKRFAGMLLVNLIRPEERAASPQASNAAVAGPGAVDG